MRHVKGCPHVALAELRENLREMARRANPEWRAAGSALAAERAYLDAADRVETTRRHVLCACPECEACGGRCAVVIHPIGGGGEMALCSECDAEREANGDGL